LTQHNGTDLTEYLIDQQPSLAVVLRQKIGSQNTHYVHGLRGIQSQMANSAWTEAMSDGLGSVRGWIDGSQNVVSSANYNPYGVPSGTVDDFGFTGEMTDANGLVYLRARYYDPNVGVFASLDPFEGVLCSPMSINGYAYVEGNPVMNSDPYGLNHRLAQILNGGMCFDILQDTDEESRDIPWIIPYRIPQGGDILPNWIIETAQRVCEQLCNPDHADNVFQHLTLQCQNQANQICDFLCSDRERNPQLEGDHEHNGLLLRWMQYYIDLRGTRSTHEHPYEIVQGYLEDYLSAYDFGESFGCGGAMARGTVRELTRVAKEWTKKKLEIPKFAIPAPVFTVPSIGFSGDYVQDIYNLFILSSLAALIAWGGGGGLFEPTQ